MTRHSLDLGEIPGWPTAMSRETAAAYLSLSPQRFDRHLRPQLREIRFGRSVRFSRQDIDALVEILADASMSPEEKAAYEALENL